MAISINTQYPGKTAGVNANYPLGQARNVTAPNDGTGTPWEAAIVNDDQGFKQALLAAAGITPSGSPDTALVSQYLDAIRYLMGFGQTYQNVTAGRAIGTTYTNTTGRKIEVYLTYQWGTPGTDHLTATVGGEVVYNQIDEGEGSAWRTGIMFSVPAGQTYRLTSPGGGNVIGWVELR